MIKRILVPWDGSETANAALMMAADLAGKTGGRLEVLYVIPSSRDWKGPLDDPRVACSIARVEDFENCVQDTSSLKNKIAAIVSNAILDVTVKVGHPGEQIIGHAKESQAALVVMGTRGLSQWKGLFLGSVSSRVAHSAPCPVLLVNQKRRIDNILVAIDDTDASRYAIRWVASLARTTNAKVALLAVDRIVPTIIPTPGAYEVVHLHTGVLAQQALDAGRRAAAEAGLEIKEIHEAGDPTEKILSVAAKGEYDVIALGSHGRGTVEDILTGGTGDRVVHMADRPVLIVR